MTEDQVFEVRDRLVRLEAGHGQIIEKLGAIKQDQDEFQYRFSELVVGNGKPGIQTRLDRIEQRHLNSVKLYWLLVAAMATSVAERAWTWFKKS